MKNTIIYNRDTLKMVENINGCKTTKKFKSLDAMLEDKEITEEYILEDADCKVRVILN